MKLRKQLLSFVATGALLLNMVAPVAAATSITITGNGYDSKNDADVVQNTSTSVVQNNTAVVTNNITSGSSSGGNTASYNTGGDTLVSAGAATSDVSVSNTLNANQANVACCNDGGVDVKIGENGALTHNYADVFINSKEDDKASTLLMQDNTAVVKNDVNSSASSGNNTASYNNNGSTTVMTGLAKSIASVSTTANGNWASIGSGNGLPGGISAVITGNGYDTHNDIDLKLNKSLDLFQTNTGVVNNDVKSEASSGGNNANYNSNGDVLVLAGGATGVGIIDNSLNFNWADVNCCATTDVLAKIAGNGALSHNELDLWLTNHRDVVQTNTGVLTNDVIANAGSGSNHANYNNGGDVGVGSGLAQTGVGITNLLNFNSANLDCCVFGIDAVVNANGAQSNNDIWAMFLNHREDFQTNMAVLGNNVGGEGAFSGNNSANYNGGGVLGGDPTVMSGGASSLTSVNNTANANLDGVTLEIPGFDFEFQFALNWAHILSVFSWL